MRRKFGFTLISRRGGVVVYTRQLGSNIVTPSGSLQDTFLYLLLSNSAPIVRAQDKGARIFGPPTLLGCLARGRVVRGPWGWRPLWQRPFSTYKSPKFYLSFTILVSFILVKYPDRIGLVNAMIWPRILVFTSMMLRVLNPAAFGSYGAGILYS